MLRHVHALGFIVLAALALDQHTLSIAAAQTTPTPKQYRPTEGPVLFGPRNAPTVSETVPARAGPALRIADAPRDREPSLDGLSTSNGRNADLFAEEAPIEDDDRNRKATDSASSSRLRNKHIVLPPQRTDEEDSFINHELRKSVERCLAICARRTERARDRDCWEVMHWLIGYGVASEIEVNRRPVSAIGWLCWNGRCKGTQLFEIKRGKPQGRVGVGVQGHQGQFLAMLAQSKVKSDYPLRVSGRNFTVADLIESEKRTCLAGEELTFKLIALSHYLPSDARWRSERRQTWDIPRLIREELKQPIVGVTCGGTHRLMGFSYAVHKRESRGEPVDGQWLRAKKYVDDFHSYAFRLQNPDGSFSTKWFEGRADNGDADRKLQTTGHITEWLVYSLPKDELHGEPITRAIEFLADLMLKNSRKKWEIGPQGHAIRALNLYLERTSSEASSSSSSDDLALRNRKTHLH